MHLFARPIMGWASVILNTWCFMEQYLENFKSCRQKEIPFCASECPFHLDIPDFIEKMKRGGFKGAFKTYRNAVGFPMIASNLCHEPCKGACPGKDGAGAVELGLLEKACISLIEDKSPTDYNLPMKKKKVAVIGAGITGLACALRLCMKKYEVEIFEKSDRIGGSLWELLDPEVFLYDIEEQFKHEKYGLHLNTPVRMVGDLARYHFDAVYVATGEGGTNFGLLSAADPLSVKVENRDQYCELYGNTGWFSGGGLVGETPIYALAGGLNMGTVIDNFLKTGKLLYPDNVRPTIVCMDPAKLKFEKPVIPTDGRTYDSEEAQREASRCLECQCDFCRTYCDLTDYFNKWPLRIRDEIMATTLPGSADVKATPAKRLLSTCNQCGLCEETCPEDIDLGGLILAGRKSMHQQKKAPWVFHDFWLRDMDFANSDMASISKLHGIAKGNYAFFPGCQLGASDPMLVEKTYEYLLSKHTDTGLMLRCCGAPAEWSGDEEKHHKEVKTIRALWEELGKPALILACPTCMKKFKQYMTDVPVVSLYEIIADWDSDNFESEQTAACSTESRIDSENGKSIRVEADRIYSVFDACAARHEDSMKGSVRQLAEKAGYQLVSLPEQDVFARCCGYGGQPVIANPDYAEFVVQKRIAESETPYITYCINCRDIFAEAGKETVHILELLFGDGKMRSQLVTVSERRENRIRLKKRLLEKFWGEKMEEKEENAEIKLKISPELSKKLNQERILEEDLIDVVVFCERTGRRVWLPDKQAYSGYREEGFMTYWVEYREGTDKGAYELVNAYVHRMKIELEAVWNGRKTDTDL